jgi:hypothetical protein
LKGWFKVQNLITEQMIKHIQTSYIFEDSNGKYLLYSNMMPIFLDDIITLLDVIKVNKLIIESNSTDVLRGIFELYNNGWRLTGTNINIQSSSFGDVERKGIIFEKENAK